MNRILAAILAMTSGVVFAGGFAQVTVRVKQDGLMCEVLNQITECSMLPSVLAQEFGVDRNISLVVTPDGCAESAIGNVRVVVDRLRAAGYLQVSVAGSLGKPNAKCAR
jgi:hypothetical protein